MGASHSQSSGPNFRAEISFLSFQKNKGGSGVLCVLFSILEKLSQPNYEQHRATIFRKIWSTLFQKETYLSCKVTGGFLACRGRGEWSPSRRWRLVKGSVQSRSPSGLPGTCVYHASANRKSIFKTHLKYIQDCSHILYIVVSPLHWGAFKWALCFMMGAYK